jgi:predicted O-linked N-acetylglucosamine transferase (SPINDLY family)
MSRKSKKKQIGKPSVSKKAHTTVQSTALKNIQEAIFRGDLLVAKELANEFTRQNAKSPQGWEMLANIQEKQQDIVAACQSMEKALECAIEKNPLSEVKLAQYELLAGNANKAIERLKKISNEAPWEINVWVALSKAYHLLGLNKEALEANDLAFKLDADYPVMLMLRARILDQLKRHKEAFVTARQVKKLAPYQQGVSNYLATLSLREGDYETAEKYFNDELSLADNSEASYNAFIAKHYNPNYTAEELTETARNWQERYLKDIVVEKVETLPRKNKRLRIGFLSGGFRRHPVGQMILPALKKIKKSELELYFYTTNQVVDYLTLEIKELADSWNSVSELNDEQLNQKIRDDSIDILIDMNGGGEGSKFTTLAKKPAPIIVKWVGILINTTGLKCFDYLLSDSVETPSNVDNLYTEKLIRMPDDYICYHLPHYIPKVSGLPALKNQFITFGCLNNPAKLSGVLIQEWAKLLQDVPNSKLLLRGIQFEGDDFCQRTFSRFAECGIGSERLLLEGPGKHEEFLKTYQRIDIALDTWPYSGGLTTCEALAMGVPVVTCVGPTFAGRHSATHLANSGLPELVTDNWSDFRKRAKELASDLPNLAVIRAALRTILIESPVCDGERFAKHFTKAMRGIWQRHCEGKVPEALTFNKDGDAWFADENQVIELLEVEAEPEPQEAEFEWSLESPITVIDNGALFARHPRFTEWMQTGNFAVITFDPGSLLTKQADELKQLGEWHHYPHATLGDGKDATLYATLDPELTGTLQPSEERQTDSQEDPLRVLSALPISTVALDSIEGLPSVDVLVLDDLNDVVSIINNGAELLKNVLMIKVRVSFQLSHELQPKFSKIEDMIEGIGFRFYSFIDLSYLKIRADEVVSRGCLGGELAKATAIFVPNAQRLKGISYEKKSKIKICLDSFLEIDGVAHNILHESSASRASFAFSKEVIPKCDDKSKENKRHLVDIPNISDLPDDVREAELKKFLVKFNKEVVSDVSLRNYFDSACGRLEEDDSNLTAFYILIKCLRLGVVSNHKLLPSELIDRLERIGWKDKINIFSFWLKEIIDTEKESVDNPEVSVVVVTRNINEKVIENVRELSRQTVGGEVIVLTDDIKEVNKICIYADKIIELNGNAGASHARNIGAALSRSSVILFVDDDGFPQDNFVLSHLEAHKNYDVHSVRGMCSQPSMLPSPQHYNLGNKVIPYPVNLEGNASYKTEVFYEVGGWDDSIMYGHEGIELSYRLLRKYNAPEKQIYHPAPLLYHEYIKNKAQGKAKAYKQHVSHLLILNDNPLYQRSVSDKFSSLDVSEVKMLNKSKPMKMRFNKD